MYQIGRYLHMISGFVKGTLIVCRCFCFNLIYIIWKKIVGTKITSCKVKMIDFLSESVENTNLWKTRWIKASSKTYISQCYFNNFVQGLGFSSTRAHLVRLCTSQSSIGPSLSYFLQPHNILQLRMSRSQRFRSLNQFGFRLQVHTKQNCQNTLSQKWTVQYRFWNLQFVKC